MMYREPQLGIVSIPAQQAKVLIYQIGEMRVEQGNILLDSYGCCVQGSEYLGQEVPRARIPDMLSKHRFRLS